MTISLEERPYPEEMVAFSASAQSMLALQAGLFFTCFASLALYGSTNDP